MRSEPPAAWLELAVEADLEAVEAVSEILGRVASGGTSVEPGFELVDEGLGARIDPARPAVVRGYVPAGDQAVAEAAAAEVAEALGHLQAFGLRPIGELRTRIVHEADWAEAWKAFFPVLRVGRRLVIRPTWRRHRARPGDVVLALDPGMAFGTGLHPTTRLCLAALEPLADDGRLAEATVLDVGCGSGILAIAALRLGAASALGVDTDPIAIESTLANARRNRLAPRLRARAGSLPTGGRALRRRPGQPHRRCARPAAPLTSATSCDRAARSWRRASSSTARATSGRPSSRLACASSTERSRATGSRWSPGGPDGSDDLLDVRSAGCPPACFPILLATHVILAVSLFLPSILLPFALRTRRAAVDSDSGLVRTLLWGQSHGTLVIGAGLALTGVGLIATLGPTLLQQPWLLVALLIYAANLALAFFIQRPNLRRLVGITAAADDRVWLDRARRQRYVSYLMAGLVGVIGFLMSTKPSL